jgi:hypothetical protein
MNPLQTFCLDRKIDDSGVSGIGVVAVGCKLPSGKVVIEWVVGTHRSVEIHDSVEDLLAIHGHGDHTEVKWADPKPCNCSDTNDPIVCNLSDSEFPCPCLCHKG